MAKGIGLLSRRFESFTTCLKALMPSLPVWQALLEGLKVTMIVPHPLGISPQTQVSCR